MRVEAASIPESLNVQGGFIVHLGCGKGERTLDLRPNERYQAHGLDEDPKNVSQARVKVKEAGVGQAKSTTGENCTTSPTQYPV